MAEGIVGAYVHIGGRIGALVELRCETPSVAGSREFHRLAHELAMQVAATEPLAIGSMDYLEEEAADETRLLNQRFIRDPNLTIRQLIAEASTRLGERVSIGRFRRFVAGEKE